MMREMSATLEPVIPDLGKSARKELDFPAANRIGVLLFCAYVIVWYLQVGNRVPMLGAIRFEFIFAALLALTALVATSKRNLGCPLYGYIALLLVAMAIQLPFSWAPALSWTTFVDRVLKFAVMGIFIVLFVRSPSALTLFLGAFLLACLKMGQEGLVGKLTGSMMWQNQGTMRLHGSTPLYTHPNSFSGMALGTVPFIMALWPIANRPVRVFLGILLFLSLNIIVFTGSRTGYVGLALLILYAFRRSSNKRRYFAVAATAILLSVALVPGEYVERFESIFTRQEKEGQSAVKRVEILEDAVQIFRDHPFGVGVDAFTQVRLETFGRIQDTHNLYLQVATNLGIQGLIIFLVLIYKALTLLHRLSADLRQQIERVRGLRGDRSPPERQEEAARHLKDLLLMRATAEAAMLFIVVRLALGLFGHDLYEIYWWFALGVIIALHNMNKVAGERSARLTAS